MANSQNIERNSFIQNVNLLARELESVSTILEVVNSGIIDEVLANTEEIADTMDQLRQVAAQAAGFVTQAEEAAENAASILLNTQELVSDLQTVGATATTLTPGTPATATYNHSNNVLELGIPQGNPGIQGPRGPEGVRGLTGATGEQGIQGPQGPAGPAGTGVNILGQKATDADLPPTGAGGNAWLVGTAIPYDLFIWDITLNTWVNVGPISGTPGEQGPEGPQGPVGPALNILGSVSDINELPATGVPGEGWLIEGNLYLWDTTDSVWFNAGNLQGPEGPQGPAGNDGAPGPPGPPGAGNLLLGNVTYYISQTGNDLHSGKTATVDGTNDTDGKPNGPKATWLGMMALLAGTNPGQFAVTVKIAGIIGGNVQFKMPQFAPSNLILSGSDQANDGVSGNLIVVAGGFSFDRIRVGQLQVGANGTVYAQGKIIRFTGISAIGYALGANTALGKIDLVGCILEYSGDYSDFINCTGGDIGFVGCTYTPIGTPTFTGKDVRMTNGGIIAIDNMSALPNGGTIIKTNPGFANIVDITKVVTQAEYDALDSTKITNGVLYLISE